jgi:predicted Rossmann fold nucleotide-binding protein DprA/Smf involved in DNA uptake
VVGSRSATPQGVEDAGRFARAISDAGLTVISGLALGIDAAAHRGALAGPGGTIAVIGTGADIVIPPSTARWRTRSPPQARSCPNGRSARRPAPRTSGSATG